MSKSLFSIIAIFSLLFASFNMAFAHENEREKVTIGVKGLVCEFCAATIKKAFSKNKTIESTTVSLGDKTVILVTKGVGAVKDDYITKTILDNGYNVDGEIKHQPCHMTCDVTAVPQTEAEKAAVAKEHGNHAGHYAGMKM